LNPDDVYCRHCLEGTLSEASSSREDVKKMPPWEEAETSQAPWEDITPSRIMLEDRYDSTRKEESPPEGPLNNQAEKADTQSMGIKPINNTTTKTDGSAARSAEAASEVKATTKPNLVVVGTARGNPTVAGEASPSLRSHDAIKKKKTATDPKTVSAEAPSSARPPLSPTHEGLQTIEAGSLSIRIPHRRGFLNLLNKVVAKNAWGRALVSVVEASSVYAVVVGRFWVGVLMACLTFPLLILRGLLSRGRFLLYAKRAAFSLVSNLRWSGLFSRDFERIIMISSSLLMAVALLGIAASLPTKASVFAPYAGISIAVGLILRRALEAAGRRTIESQKPHWYADWTDTTSLSSVEIYDLNLGFEKTVADMFSELGFKTTHVGVENSREILGHNGSGDQGVDVMADDRSGKRLIVSCKRYSGKVGPDEIKILHMDLVKMRAMPVHAGKELVGVLVTPVGFTSGAVDLATELNIATLTLEGLRDQAEKQFLY
jgi:hypothetical protein